ncbi:hypothetical protein LXL04_025823 [Taraxacum kok-saghyz]
MNMDSRRSSIDGGGRLSLDLGNSVLSYPIQQNPNWSPSDTDSVSSGSTSGIQETKNNGSSCWDSPPPPQLFLLATTLNPSGSSTASSPWLIQTTCLSPIATSPPNFCDGFE